MQRITGSLFLVSFHLDWQIDNDIFNRPIMERTQILVRFFADGINQSLVSSVTHARLRPGHESGIFETIHAFIYLNSCGLALDLGSAR